MNRRAFMQALSTLLAGLAASRPAQAEPLFRSPVMTNRLRPPGAVDERLFAGKCIRCGRCVEVCPYRCIVPLDIRHGIHAGTPLINVQEIPCYLCMKCVKVCPTGTLRQVTQLQTSMGMAVLNRHLCFNYQEMTLCRTCYDVCPLKEQAIRLEQLRPVVVEEHCVGCGICVYSCPLTAEDGRKAINVEPLHLAGDGPQGGVS